MMPSVPRCSAMAACRSGGRLHQYSKRAVCRKWITLWAGATFAPWWLSSIINMAWTATELRCSHPMASRTLTDENENKSARSDLRARQTDLARQPSGYQGGIQAEVGRPVVLRPGRGGDDRPLPPAHCGDEGLAFRSHRSRCHVRRHDRQRHQFLAGRTEQPVSRARSVVAA